MLKLLTPRKQLMGDVTTTLPIPYQWDDTTLVAALESALDEPPFLDRERQSIAEHLAELRAEALRITADIATHEAETAQLQAELAERQRSIEAHEAAAAKLT